MGRTTISGQLGQSRKTSPTDLDFPLARTRGWSPREVVVRSALLPRSAARATRNPMKPSRSSDQAARRAAESCASSSLLVRAAPNDVPGAVALLPDAPVGWGTVVGVVPAVGGPLLNVADHVVQTEGVGGETTRRAPSSLVHPRHRRTAGRSPSHRCKFRCLPNAYHPPS